jgi:excisionase family DNA binding protein
MMAVEKLLSVADVAELLGVSIHTVYAWAARRRLPVVKVGTRTMFAPHEIQRWVGARSRTEGPAAEEAARPLSSQLPAAH